MFSVNTAALRHVTPCTFILRPDNVSGEAVPFLLSSKAAYFSEMLSVYIANGVTFKKRSFSIVTTVRVRNFLSFVQIYRTFHNGLRDYKHL